VTFKTASGEESFETGDAYYVPPGHTPVLYAGTEIVEFSPTEQLQQTLEVCHEEHGSRRLRFVGGNGSSSRVIGLKVSDDSRPIPGSRRRVNLEDLHRPPRARRSRGLVRRRDAYVTMPLSAADTALDPPLLSNVLEDELAATAIAMIRSDCPS
jgi:hypothetical protein